MNYIDIPVEYRIHKEIPTEKFDVLEYANRITWTGAIKSSVSGVAESITDTVHYEEIQLLHCEIADRKMIYDVGQRIYKAIKYPCIIEFQIGTATTIGACEFRIGKTDSEKNVLHSLCFSHWLHEDILSPHAQEMISSINMAIRKKTDMADIYNDVRYAILSWKMSGTTKAHVDRIIRDLIGKGKISPERIRKYCQPFEYHAVLPGNGRYETQRREKSYLLIHDYEEIWYCLMKCPETRRIIELRRYRNMEDLLYSIDSKGW